MFALLYYINYIYFVKMYVGTRRGAFLLFNINYIFNVIKLNKPFIFNTFFGIIDKRKLNNINIWKKIKMN